MLRAQGCVLGGSQRSYTVRANTSHPPRVWGLGHGRQQHWHGQHPEEPWE